MLLVVLALLVVEGAIVEFVLALILGESPWVWVVLGLHLYVLIWVGGLIGSLHVRPHLVEQRSLRLRDSVFTELSLPYAALADVQVARRANLGRSGFKLDRQQGSALLAYGEATVVLSLHPRSRIYRNGEPYEVEFTELAITADDPNGFRQVVDHQLARLTPSD
ncbi:MAG: hypothetical protein ACRDQ5_24290 [Sciscionella sp.]